MDFVKFYGCSFFFFFIVLGSVLFYFVSGRDIVLIYCCLETSENKVIAQRKPIYSSERNIKGLAGCRHICYQEAMGVVEQTLWSICKAQTGYVLSTSFVGEVGEIPWTKMNYSWRLQCG